MPLKLKNPPGPSTKEVTLPSEGYPYQHAELKGGKILIKAFDFDTESIMYGTADSPTSKQFARLCTLLARTVTWPPGFKTAELLEGDASFIIMAARSLTYPEQKYEFDTVCDHCGEKEHYDLRIPDEIPQNRYPTDFQGYITLDTFNGNSLKMRFLTLADDAECSRMSRDRQAKKIILEDLYDADYNLNRLCKHLVEANGTTPDNIEDSRQFFKAMPSDEREEIIRAMRKHGPGISSILTINCPKCAGQYEAFVPLGADFFRAGGRTIRAKLPGGVRISCFGPDDFRDKSERAAAPGDDRVSDPAKERGKGGPGKGSEVSKKVIPEQPKEIVGEPVMASGELRGPYDRPLKKAPTPLPQVNNSFTEEPQPSIQTS